MVLIKRSDFEGNGGFLRVFKSRPMVNTKLYLNVSGYKQEPYLDSTVGGK